MEVVMSYISTKLNGYSVRLYTNVAYDQSVGTDAVYSYKLWCIKNTATFRGLATIKIAKLLRDNQSNESRILAIISAYKAGDIVAVEDIAKPQATPSNVTLYRHFYPMSYMAYPDDCVHSCPSYATCKCGEIANSADYKRCYDAYLYNGGKDTSVTVVDADDA